MCSFLFVSVEYFLFVCCVMVLLIANILLAADVMPVLTSTFVSFSPLSRYLLWLHSALLLFLLAHHFQTSLIVLTICAFSHLTLLTPLFISWGCSPLSASIAFGLSALLPPLWSLKILLLLCLSQTNCSTSKSSLTHFTPSIQSNNYHLQTFSYFFSCIGRQNAKCS